MGYDGLGAENPAQQAPLLQESIEVTAEVMTEQREPLLQLSQRIALSTSNHPIIDMNQPCHSSTTGNRTYAIKECK